MDPDKNIGVNCLELENFNGSNFNAWRRKIIFRMQLLKIYYVISEEKPNFKEDSETEASWEWDALLQELSPQRPCRLSCKCLLQQALCKRCLECSRRSIQGRGEFFKSHIIDNFLDFKFDDDTEVLPQVKELEKLVIKLKDEKITLYNTFIFGSIVSKLPLSWISFSTDIHRRKKQVLLSDLKRFIQTEDQSRTRVKIELLAKQKVPTNMVTFKSEKDFFKKKKFKKKNQNLKNMNVQTKEFKKTGRCFNCDM